MPLKVKIILKVGPLAFAKGSAESPLLRLLEEGVGSEVSPCLGGVGSVFGHQFVDLADEVGFLGAALADLAPVV